ncbi:MAG TPA: NUDIX domain-containing protein [Kiritimatiellia bacterium]|nr:NUDIX domain-containing protein [Kiritimatiellia bacterium]
MTSFIDHDLYKKILEAVPIACVDVAIVVDGSVLLALRKDDPAKGQWWLPGGRVHKGEKLKEAAARKAREEVGLECHVGPAIHTAETVFPDGPYGVAVHSINTCFFLYPKGPVDECKLDDHHEAVRWIREIPSGLHPYVEQCLIGAGLQKA